MFTVGHNSPYVLPGWTVDVRNGQYRASRMRGNGQNLRRGKEGWFGREDQPPGPLMIVTHLTQVGVIIWGCPGSSCRCRCFDGGGSDVFGCGGGSCLGLCD